MWPFKKSKNQTAPAQLPDRKHAELVKNIRNHPGNKDKEYGTQAVLGEFAEFLSALAADADQSAAKNESLQKSIRDYTIALLVLTGVLLVLGLGQIGVSVWAVYTQKNSQSPNPANQCCQPQNQ